MDPEQERLAARKTRERARHIQERDMVQASLENVGFRGGIDPWYWDDPQDHADSPKRNFNPEPQIVALW